MRSILEYLVQAPEIRGCLVLTKDGVVVEKALPAGVNGDAFAALASHMAIESVRATRRGGIADFQRIVLAATRGTLVLTALEDVAYLVVAVQKSMDLDQTMLDIEGAAQRLVRKMQLSAD
jgi:predicted regulator of Ras-like GTPase activity (Roadblock/LC7/MglB family)